MGFFDDLKSITSSLNEVKDSITQSIDDVKQSATDATTQLGDSVQQIKDTAAGQGKKDDDDRQNDESTV